MNQYDEQGTIGTCSLIFHEGYGLYIGDPRLVLTLGVVLIWQFFSHGNLKWCLCPMQCPPWSWKQVKDQLQMKFRLVTNSTAVDIDDLILSRFDFSFYSCSCCMGSRDLTFQMVSNNGSKYKKTMSQYNII